MRAGRRLFLAAASGGALLLASPAAVAAPRTFTIVINQLKFSPAPAVLHQGDVIIWVNRDILRHSATAGDHSFDLDLAPGARGQTIMKKKGPIPFSCRYHPGMRGVLQVR